MADRRMSRARWRGKRIASVETNHHRFEMKGKGSQWDTTNAPMQQHAEFQRFPSLAGCKRQKGIRVQSSSMAWGGGGDFDQTTRRYIQLQCRKSATGYLPSPCPTGSHPFCGAFSLRLIRCEDADAASATLEDEITRRKEGIRIQPRVLLLIVSC